MRAPRRNEDGIARVLVYAERLDAVFLEEFRPKCRIEVKHLRMDRVLVLVLSLVKLFHQELADFVGVLGAEQVPHRTSRLAVRPWGRVQEDVDSISDIHVESRGAHAAGVFKGSEGVVHLGSNVRTSGTSRELESARGGPLVAYMRIEV